MDKEQKKENHSKYIDYKYGIIKVLEEQYGFKNIDSYTIGSHGEFDLYRQNDDDPKMDIEIRFVEHQDDL